MNTQEIAEMIEKNDPALSMRQDATEQYLYPMLDVLLYAYTVQAVRPTCHWWLRPRVLAWFRVLMVLSLVKPPAAAGPLSRIGDYLFAARGPGLFLRFVHSPQHKGDYG